MAKSYCVRQHGSRWADLISIICSHKSYITSACVSLYIMSSHNKIFTVISETGEKRKEILAQRINCGLDPKLNSYLAA